MKKISQGYFLGMGVLAFAFAPLTLGATFFMWIMFGMLYEISKD